MALPPAHHHDSEKWVRDLLASQPKPTMPPTVLARLEAVIREEARARTASVTGESRHRRSGATRAWFGVAAAAAAITVLGLALASQTVGSNPAVTAGGCATGTAVEPVLRSTGTKYTAAELAEQASRLVDNECSNAGIDLPTAVTEATPRTTTGLSETDSDRLSVPRSSFEPPRGLDRAGRDCAMAAAAGRPILAVDRGFFNSLPVTVVVVSGPEKMAQAFVLDCRASARNRVLYTADVAL